MEDSFRQLCVEGIKWGPGLILALVVLFGVFKFSQGMGIKLVSALDKPTGALKQQAQSMDRLTASIQEYVHRDFNEHQEIIILQKVIREELKGIRDQSGRIEQRFDRFETLIREMNHGGPPIRNA